MESVEESLQEVAGERILSHTIDKGFQRKGGISVFLAATFICGVRAGTGLLALPKALSQAGWSGILLILASCLTAAYNGVNLGKCWTMLMERYPEIRSGQERRPYPTIGQKAFGNWMRPSVNLDKEADPDGGQWHPTGV